MVCHNVYLARSTFKYYKTIYTVIDPDFHSHGGTGVHSDAFVEKRRITMIVDDTLKVFKDHVSIMGYTKRRMQLFFFLASIMVNFRDPVITRIDYCVLSFVFNNSITRGRRPYWWTICVRNSRHIMPHISPTLDSLADKRFG
jgi:hypothetical protein